MRQTTMTETGLTLQMNSKSKMRSGTFPLSKLVQEHLHPCSTRQQSTIERQCSKSQTHRLSGAVSSLQTMLFTKFKLNLLVGKSAEKIQIFTHSEKFWNYSFLIFSFHLCRSKPTKWLRRRSLSEKNNFNDSYRPFPDLRSSSRQWCWLTSLKRQIWKISRKLSRYSTGQSMESK